MESKAKTTITFHSGILTIGGTVIEVAYKDAHLFFDFGTEFRPELDLADDNLETLLENRLIPELTNVYDPRLEGASTSEEVFTHSAAFLSHAHLDHSRMINYLDPAIPLYALKETKSILNTLNQAGEFLIPSPFEEKGFTRSIIGLEANDLIEVGEISVEIVPVDHDAYGAAALLIRTPDHLITYSGDLRLHGHNPEDTFSFCEKAKGTDVLMMEGVSISFPERPVANESERILSEEELVLRFANLVLDNPTRQITFNGYPANVQRFVKLIEKCPRTMVLEATMAALLLEIFDYEVPYYYASQTKFIEALNPTLEHEYAELLEDQKNYVWQVVEHHEQLQTGSLYIHSDAQPLGDFDPAYAVFLQTLADRNIEFVRMACTGHAFAADLDRIVSLIQPKLLVPIHTLHPEKLENPYGERILPDRGSSITL